MMDMDLDLIAEVADGPMFAEELPDGNSLALVTCIVSSLVTAACRDELTIVLCQSAQQTEQGEQQDCPLQGPHAAEAVRHDTGPPPAHGRHDQRHRTDRPRLPL